MSPVKRVLVDPLMSKRFFTCMSDGTLKKILPSDYNRTLIKAHQKKTTKWEGHSSARHTTKQIEPLRVPT
jgi:hypothetical protein